MFANQVKSTDHTAPGQKPPPPFLSQLGAGDKTYSIIQQGLTKLGLAGEAKDYDLFQVLADRRKHY